MRDIMRWFANRFLALRIFRAPWLNRHTFWLVIVLVAFFSVTALSEPSLRRGHLAADLSTSTPSLAVVSPVETVDTPPPADTRPTATPIPPEFIENREQTNGIIAGTIILLLIVIIGTLSGLRARLRE
jgi:hypothetical protein